MKKTTTLLAGTVLSGALAFQGTISEAQQLSVSSKVDITSDETIRPFRANILNADIKDLRKRLMDTRWPDQETVTDQSQGVRLSQLKGLVEYWGSSYDWRKAEAKLNRYPQFMTKIDDVDIHFIQVRSKEPNALPVIISHGWPGSVFELIKIIDPLTNPTAYGGKSEDAFDVIIPSLPGFGFSGKPTAAGWDNAHIAKVWGVLMTRLGYTRYVAQGGDWGAGIVNQMALQAPAGLLGIHSNLPATIPNEVGKALPGGVAPAGLSEKELASFNRLTKSLKDGDFIYKTAMTGRPQGVSYGASDSPAGLAAWLLLHPGFTTWSFGADPKQSPTRDEVLDDISLYWLTNSATSAARIYWENRNGELVSAGSQKTDQINIPVAITVFPEDVYIPTESWAKRAFRHLIYFHEVDKGGHFAAWEYPQLFTEELRAAFKSLR